MSGYYLSWVLLIVISLWLSLVAFFWALKHGQLSEQERARYLPLRNEVSPPLAAHPSKLTLEVYALLSILCMGVLALLFVLITVVFRP
jgi:cbb3-type cytochrome oxidase maturation protein